MAKKKKRVAKKKSHGRKKKAATRKSAKKKAARKKKTATSRARKKTTVKKKKKKPAARKRGRKKTPAKKWSATRAAASARKMARQARSLGRPRLPGDAKLDLVFQKDYQAREIFAFLGVGTIRELEEFAPDEIIQRLAGPVVQTVERIRKALALSNRCLAGDIEFAIEFRKNWKTR